MLEQSERVFLYMLYCAANDLPDADLTEGANSPTVLALSKKTGLASFIDVYLENQQIINRDFAVARDRSIAHQIMQIREVEQFSDALEEQRIPHILFKGISLRKLYPGFATRVFGDVDIYVDKKYRKSIRRQLEKQGFSRDRTEIAEYHESFWKGYVGLEAHRAFIRGGLNRHWREFNRTAVANAVLTTGRKYQYELIPEDHFLYLLMHAYRHHISGGAGIRFLLDLWYFARSHPEAAESASVRSRLHELGLWEYADRAWTLSEKLFTTGIRDCELDAEEEKEIHALIEAGANQGANRDGQIFADVNEIKGKGWITIYFRALKKLNEKEEWYAFQSPFAYRHKWARPFVLFWISLKRVLRDPVGVRKTYSKG